MLNKVANKFNGTIIGTDTVKFTVSGDDYCLTDGTLYAVTDDGVFLPGFKKVRNLQSIERFVALRS